MSNEVCRMEQFKEEMLSWFDANEQKVIDVSLELWNHPETAFQEFKSVKTLSGWLEENGFTIEMGVASIPTAFVATYTSGCGPVIGILAEYDALTGMGYELSTTPKPTGKSGHGCGHNLFGAGSSGAAIAVKHMMDKLGIKGTIKLYGCPAEESGGAKVFMVRDGVFEGCDACITWHPAHANLVPMSSSRAAGGLRFSFHGVAAHPGTSSHIGRSAVEAIEVMDVALAFMRGHMDANWSFRTTYHIPEDDGGMGYPEAEVCCHLRTPTRQELDAFTERVRACAEGAALATGTTVDMHRDMSFSHSVMNDVLCRHALENLKRVGPPRFTEEDYRIAKELNKDVTTAQKRGLMGFIYRLGDKMCDEDLYTNISENMLKGVVAPYTGDGGDVSWNIPSCQYNVCCQTVGSANHSWQQVVCSGSHIGHAGMICAAKAIALSAAEFMASPEIIAEAKAEFDALRAAYHYTIPIDKDAKPF